MKETKVCFKCGNEKQRSDFYKHKAMSDGLLGKCKVCTRTDSKNNWELKIQDPKFIESEKERAKEKYRRLNYKERAKELNKNKPWKNSNIYKGLSKKMKIEKGMELHHWNYNNEYLTDVFTLDRATHRKLHTFLVLDKEKLVFKVKSTGLLLDSKEAHSIYARAVLNLSTF